MTPEAKALLAEVEDARDKAIDRRDRAHRLAETLRGAATALRMGEDYEFVALRLRKRGVTLKEEIPA